MNDIKHILIGTYTSGKSRGIHLYSFNQADGESVFVKEAAVENPSYLTVSRDGKHVYAVSENEDSPSYANALTLDVGNGILDLQNRLQTGGGGPCFIETDNAGKYAVSAEYAGGSISVFALNEDGSLAELIQHIEFTGKGKDPERQAEPHIHCVRFSPDGKYLFASDLGTDTIYRFEVNSEEDKHFLNEGSKVSFKTPAGSGPRHLLFHPSGKYLYLITELHGTVITFEYNNGELRAIQNIEIDNAEDNEAGDIDITPDGKFLYASSRTENDGVAVFTINSQSGKLTKTDYINTGIHPRNISVSPNGKYLLVANKDSNSVEIYVINKKTGAITSIHKDIKVDKPVCVVFV